MQAKVFIQDVYNITGIGVVPVGQVKEGILKLGMKLNIGGTIMTVKTIEMHHNQLQEAKPGDNIGFSLQGGDKNLVQSVAQTVVTLSDEGVANQPRSTPQVQQATKPEGAFGFLKKIFGKN